MEQYCIFIFNTYVSNFSSLGLIISLIKLFTKWGRVASIGTYSDSEYLMCQISTEIYKYNIKY